MKFATNKKGIIAGIAFFVVFIAAIAIPVYLTVQENRELKSYKDSIIDNDTVIENCTAR